MYLHKWKMLENTLYLKCYCLNHACPFNFIGLITQESTNNMSRFVAIHLSSLFLCVFFNFFRSCVNTFLPFNTAFVWCMYIVHIFPPFNFLLLVGCEKKEYMKCTCDQNKLWHLITYVRMHHSRPDTRGTHKYSNACMRHMPAYTVCCMLASVSSAFCTLYMTW